MFRRLLSVWVIVGTISAGGSAQGAAALPGAISFPTRSALDRLGLERQWFGGGPAGRDRAAARRSALRRAIGSFAQTSYAMVHTFDAETGRLLWSAQLGERTGFARGVAANSFAVFVTNADTFFALDKKTGRPIWKIDLGTIPTSSPACDEERAMVGLTTGKIYAFDLKNRDDKGNETILTRPWKPGTGRPAARCSRGRCPPTTSSPSARTDGKAYVVMADERTPLFRFSTGGPIGAGLGADSAPARC